MYGSKLPLQGASEPISRTSKGLNVVSRGMQAYQNLLGEMYSAVHIQA